MRPAICGRAGRPVLLAFLLTGALCALIACTGVGRALPPTTQPATGSRQHAPPERDPLEQPFASDSIWNMPIGADAVYVKAGLAPITAMYGPDGEWTSVQYVDPERIVLRPDAPMTPILYSDALWTGRSRCVPVGGEIKRVPIPPDFLVETSDHNNGAAFLMPDRRTIVQTQPFTRCSVGGPATSETTHEPDVDLYGAGISGAHGGSSLSSIGGSLRVGELRPDDPTGPRHVLKLNLNSDRELYECTTMADCFRWPATSADEFAVGRYGADGHNDNVAMRMGALLAISADVDLDSLGFETEPARKLAWTLQNYGAYVVDHGGFSFSAEDGPDGSFRRQFQADYGFDIDVTVHDDNPWMRDVNRIRQALCVVDNNSPTSVGGGGTPRQPLAAEIWP